MVTIYKQVEIDLDNDELIDMVDNSTLSVDEVFENDLIADYCSRHMAVSYIYEYDTVLNHIAKLWSKIEPELKEKFLVTIGQLKKEA